MTTPITSLENRFACQHWQDAYQRLLAGQSVSFATIIVNDNPICLLCYQAQYPLPVNGVGDVATKVMPKVKIKRCGSCSQKTQQLKDSIQQRLKNP